MLHSAKQHPAKCVILNILKSFVTSIIKESLIKKKTDGQVDKKRENTAKLDDSA